jgi:GWxTD domain-containing protein
LFFCCGLTVAAQKKDEKQAQSKEQQRARQREESGSDLKRWLDNDVAYIISDEERAAFNKLKKDEERMSCIENFWLRRDPTPDTEDNEFRDDHYARIAYANEHFASGIPGWRTDRGRIYVMWGPPDSIDESKPTGGTYYRSIEEGGGVTNVFPFERWRYRYIEGIGQEVMLEFVDSSMSGEYRLAIDGNEKDALLHVPGAGLTELEERYGIDKAERWNSDRARVGPGMGALSRVSEFDKLELYTKIQRPPEIKFKDLEAIVTTKLSFNLLPFNLQTDYIKVTEETVMVPITLQIENKDLSFQEQDEVQIATAHVYGKITTIFGRTQTVFEDTVKTQVPTALFKAKLEEPAMYQKTLFLPPGQYKLDFVVKDVQTGNAGTTAIPIRVPRYSDQTLATSTLILADAIQDLPGRLVQGMFILGDKKVYPNVREEFRRDKELNYWMQVYGLKVDAATHKPSATVETLIIHNGREVKKLVEDSKELSNAAQQMTLIKSLPLADFEPGQYTIQVKVTDNLAKQVTTQPPVKFVVR